MSYTETRKGKIIKICDELDIERYCSEIAYCKQIPLGEYDDYKELVEEEFGERYMILNGALYEVLENTELPEEGFLIGNKNEKGEIDFFVQYYNGGAGLHEVLECVIDNLDSN